MYLILHIVNCHTKSDEGLNLIIPEDEIILFIYKWKWIHYAIIQGEWRCSTYWFFL